MNTNKRGTSMRLTPTANKLIEALSKKLGVNKTSVLEMAIRAFAEQHNVAVSDEGATDE